MVKSGFSMALSVGLVAMLISCGGEASSRSERAEPLAGLGLETELRAVPDGPLPDGVTPLAYQLDLVVQPERDDLSGRVAIRVALDEPRQIIRLHGWGLTVERVSANVNGESFAGRFVSTRRTGDAAVLFEAPLVAGEATLTFEYSAPLRFGTHGALSRVVDDASYVFTHFEPLGARLAFPCFDEPRFKTPFTVRLSIPHGQVAVSSAPRRPGVEVGTAVDVVRFETTPPIATYQLAFAVGPLDQVPVSPVAANALRRHPVSVTGYAPRGRGPELAALLGAGREAIEAIESKLGVPFPYPKADFVAVPALGPLAMENVGLMTFRLEDHLYESPGPLEGYRIRAVAAHEVAHQWFGNLVTMRWWDDLWLNESFATWVEVDFLEGGAPADSVAAARRIEDLHWTMDRDTYGDARALHRTVPDTEEIDRASDSLIYQKGAAVLSMVEAMVGEDAFIAALRAYLGDHAHQTIDLEHLVAALRTTGPRAEDAARFLRSFVETPGLPLLEVEARCEASGAELRIRQRRSSWQPAASSARTDPWVLPWCARVGTRGGAERVCGILDEAEAEVPLAECPEWIMPNADAAGYYRFWAPPAAVEALFGHWSALHSTERAALVDSLKAAVRDGRFPADRAMTLLLAHIDDPVREVALSAGELGEFAIRNVLSPDNAAVLREHLRERYAAEWARVGERRSAADPASLDLFRLHSAMWRLLALDLEDPEIRRHAADQAARFLGFGGDGQLHPEALPVEILNTSLQVALEEADRELYEHVVSLLSRVQRDQLRIPLIRATGFVRDPALSERTRALSTELEGQGWCLGLVAQLRRPDTVLDTLDFFAANSGRLRRHGYGPSVLRAAAAAACDMEVLERVEDVSRRSYGLGEVAERLAPSVERAEACIAAEAATADGFRAYVSRLRTAEAS